MAACHRLPTTVMARASSRSSRPGGAELVDGVVPRSDDPDAAIVALIDRGERAAALTALMRRHGVAVYRYCREELHDRTLADDVHQQIFIQAHRDLRSEERRLGEE